MIKKLLKMIHKKPEPNVLNLKKTELCSGYYPVHTATTLLEPHRKIIATIRQYFGVPDDVWKSVHESLLRNFARRVQLLPVSEADSEPGGLLRLSLESANHAMKIRRGYMLPNGAASECISEQTEIWSFAAYSSALLRNIEKSVTEATISLRNHKGDESRWSLVHGDIPFDVSYRPEFQPQQPVQHNEPTPLLVAEQIISQIALEWLTSYPEVHKMWRLTLSGQYDEAGTFGEIIRQTDHSAQPVAPLRSKERRGKNHNPGNSPQASFSSNSEIPQADLQNTIFPPGIENIQIRADKSEANEQQNQSEPGGESSFITQLSASQQEKKLKREAAHFFVKWLRQQIIEDKIGFNQPTSQLHTVEEGLFLATPVIFTRYLKKRGSLKLKTLQSGFLSLGLHKTQGYKQPNWTYCYQGNKKDKTLEGILIPDPLTALNLVELPEVNPLMSAEMPKAGNINKSGVSNDNNNLTTRKP